MKCEHRYEHGPTTCRPRPDVMKSIQKEIKASHALSRGDIRLATRMGLISANTLRPLGFNDGVFFPVAAAMAAAADAPASAVPTSLIRRKTVPKTMHALALMVDFSDNKGTRPPSDFAHLIFDANNPNSMTSYYRTISNGMITVTGEVTNYIRAPKPYSFYVDGQSGMGENFPHNTPGLLVDVLKKFCQNDNLKRFDLDGDGFVDGIFLIHAGGGAEAEPDKKKRPDLIWSHKWVLPEPFENQGVKVFAYSTEPEDGRLGVFAHEFGHVLGLPDLYDGTARSEGLGDWCLMAGGEWGDGGDQPTRMSAWCLSQLGWVKPKVVKKETTVTLSPLAKKKTHCYRLWTGGAKGPEYFLIENRQPTGQDAELPGSGLAVWHIDERQSSNDNALAYMVALVQADGKRDLEFNRNGGDDADLFPGKLGVKKLDDSTNPSTRANDGSLTGVSLSQIAEKNGEVKVTLKV